jgi:hypothetical protein
MVPRLELLHFVTLLNHAASEASTAAKPTVALVTNPLHFKAPL